MWKLEVSESNVAIALATGQCREYTVQGRGKFHILSAKWRSLRPFSVFFGISFTIEGIKVLGEQILEKS